MANDPVNGLVIDRLETMILARLSTSSTPPSLAALATDLQRYAPAPTAGGPAWPERIADAVRSLTERGIVDADRRVAHGEELKRRTGAHAVKRWPQWTDRILPGLALGVRADDAKAHKRLADRDAWAAAIVARAHGLWTGGVSPTANQLGNAMTWRALGLAGAPKTCPPEIRAHFLKPLIAMDAGPPDRMVRQLAAQLTGAPRVELKAFYLALVRGWLVGRSLAAEQPAGEQPATEQPPPLLAAPARDTPSLIAAVRAAADDARAGVFGDRKVFISAVWDALRATPRWTALALDDFKAELVSAHRARALVLARADLVAAMDPALVAASETRTDGATFHFIVREPMP